MQVWAFCFLMMSAFSAALGLSIIAPFLPELAAHHGANGFWIGMIFAGFGLSRGIVTPFIGRVSDRVGRKIFVAGGLFVYTVASVLYTKADNIGFLILVRVLHGFSAGMILPIVMTYIGELSRQGREGSTIGIMNTVLYMGVAAGPLIGGEIAERYGFNAVFYTMAALGAITFFLVVFFLPEVKGHTPGIKAARVAPFNIMAKYDYIKAFLIMSFISVALSAIFMSFLPSIAIKDFVDMMHIGFIISVSIFIAGLLQIPFGRIADRHSRLGKLLQCSIGISVSMIAILVLPLCPDFRALFLTGCFMGAGIAITAPALSSFSVGIGQKGGMGTWMGIFWATMSAGLVTAPIAAGIIMDRFGVDPVFYSFGIFAFFAVLLCLHYIYRKQIQD
ncbi:MAG: MFS transporter [Candidatus Omnitrophota bacterium]|nr:MFS transporter [Candidatus Omnitrophota bacterium]